MAKQHFTSEQWMALVKEKHGDTYDYSKTIFTTLRDKVVITCAIHGDFQIRAKDHRHGSGCQECSELKSRIRTTVEDFVTESQTHHGLKYDYSKVKFSTTHQKVTIGCPIHGYFEQKARYHQAGGGCKECADDSMRVNLAETIQKMASLHHGRYDYSMVTEIGTRKKIPIICHQHGVFHQQARHHLRGQGCPNCSESKGETKIRRLLSDLSVEFLQEHRFTDCKNKSPLPFDFFLPSLNICIEFQGIQHYEPIRWSKSMTFEQASENHERVKISDRIKQEFCRDKHLGLIEIPYDKFDDIESILNSAILGD